MGSGGFPGDLLELFYPRTCVECGNRSERDSRVLCYACLTELPRCQFSHHPGNRVEALFRGRLRIEAATSYLYFKKKGIVQRLMHELKYKGREDIGDWIGERLAEEMQAGGRFRNVDLVVPVPLHRKKRRKRGYNQAAEFGRLLADRLDLEYDELGLKRDLEGKSQTGKDRSERYSTLNKAFSVNRTENLKGKHVLIVDDIITSGATLEACAKNVLRLPGTRVSLASMAFTL